MQGVARVGGRVQGWMDDVIDGVFGAAGHQLSIAQKLKLTALH